MAADEWIMVRLQRTTHHKLSLLREAMELSNKEGKSEYEVNRDDLLSLNAVVEILVDREWSKRNRSGSRNKKAIKAALLAEEESQRAYRDEIAGRPAKGQA